MSHRPLTKLLLGMSKCEEDNEIDISKSNFWLDGLYKDTFPLIFLKSNSSGKLTLNPS